MCEVSMSKYFGNERCIRVHSLICRARIRHHEWWQMVIGRRRYAIRISQRGQCVRLLGCGGRRRSRYRATRR